MPNLTIKVLLVEDSNGDASFVTMCLSKSTTALYKVDRVDRVGAGEKKLAEEEFDVILLDLCLPDSRGYETFQRIHIAAGHTPIILMTGLDDDQLTRQAIREGAQDYLVKRRVDNDRLERSIRYAIERKRALEELREAKERYDLALRGSNDGIWDWNLRTGEMYFSVRWKTMLGYSSQEIGSSADDWFRLIHPDHQKQVLAELEAHKRGETEFFENEHLMQHKDGAYRWVLSRGLAVKDSSGRVYRMAGSQADITHRKKTEVQLRYDALHDALTHLPNRALLMDHLGLAIAQSQRSKDYKFAVLIIDLDRFKVVNDSLGHVIGDKLLMGIASRLESLIRPLDTVARFGGDEFVILLSDITDLRDATRVAERIHDKLKKPFQLSGYKVITTASIGIALSMTGYDRPEHILRDADTAMYRAKAAGKARHEVFDMDMHNSAMSLLKLETELRRAVERNEFTVHYQPIITFETGDLSGFEALVRWNHPERGLIFPDEFIPMAEETGLIVQLGMWVLKEACRQMAEWKHENPSMEGLSVSVNLSSRQLAQPNLAQEIQHTLINLGLHAYNMKLEITESMIIESESSVLDTLNQLHAMGIRLQVDDFGTGYCSLSYLHRFPIDDLKIDRSFMNDIPANRDNLEILQTIVMLAKNLGMQVIAEGVETHEQFNLLKRLNVKQGQGFYFSKALANEDIKEMLMAK